MGAILNVCYAKGLLILKTQDKVSDLSLNNVNTPVGDPGGGGGGGWGVCLNPPSLSPDFNIL